MDMPVTSIFREGCELHRVSNELFIAIKNELKHAYQPWGRVSCDSTWSSGRNLAARPSTHFEILCRHDGA